MNGIGGWFRQMTTKLGAGLRRFMEGRYGSDKLGIFMLRVALVLMVIDLFLPAGLIKLVMWILAYGLMIWSIIRGLSRNIYKRYEENRKNSEMEIQLSLSVAYFSFAKKLLTKKLRIVSIKVRLIMITTTVMRKYLLKILSLSFKNRHLYFTSNLYPTPQTVFKLHSSETPSSFSRSLLTCTSTVLESP